MADNGALSRTGAESEVEVLGAIFTLKIYIYPMSKMIQRGNTCTTAPCVHRVINWIKLLGNGQSLEAIKKGAPWRPLSCLLLLSTGLWMLVENVWRLLDAVHC